MLRGLIFGLMVLSLVCGAARDVRAGLVQIDDFSSSGVPAALSVNGFVVNRTISGGSYNNALQSWSLEGTGSLSISYSVVGGTFADLAGSGFSGFRLNISRNGTGATSAIVSTDLGDNSGPFVIKTPSVRMDYLLDGFDGKASVVTLTFTQSGRPGAKLNVNAFSAVPEPSAMLLVVSALGLAAVRRRRC